MNIFALDRDPGVAARYHCDRHVIKMLLESAQLLSTALHLHGITAPYKPTHKNHPCTVWAAASRENFVWLISLARSLGFEHQIRYQPKTPHKSLVVVDRCAIHAGKLPSRGSTPFAQAMPEDIRGEDPIEAYRRYYRECKADIARWREPRSEPFWWGQ